MTEDTKKGLKLLEETPESEEVHMPSEVSAGPVSLMETYQGYIDSGMLPGHLKTPQQVLVVIAMGKELGIKPMAAIKNIAPINGMPSLNGICMMKICQQAKVIWKTVDDFVPCDPDKTLGEFKVQNMKTTIHFKRFIDYAPDPMEESYTFTLQEAYKAGLMNKNNWKQYVKVMMWWRCFSLGARRITGDRTLGLHTSDELGGDMDEQGSLPMSGTGTK